MKARIYKDEKTWVLRCRGHLYLFDTWQGCVDLFDEGVRLVVSRAR